MNYWWPGNKPNTWMGIIIGLVILYSPLVILIDILRRPKRMDHHGANYRGDNDNPMRILDERFTKGEIDEEEYRKRKDILKKP